MKTITPSQAIARTIGQFAIAALIATTAHAADFGSRSGPEPANIDAVEEVLRQDAYDMELLISYGTSKGGSAGHLALAIRDLVAGDDLVFSANFYADRSSEHAKGFYTKDLMVGIPKKEYLFGTTSTLGDTASFGLDFGEIYKRSVVGIRVFGVPRAEKEALVAFFKRINDDYHRQATNTDYHNGEVRYDYLRLNCAKTIGSAFKFGAGYADLEITGTKVLPALTRVVAGANANIPTEMAMKLAKQWHERGYGMDVVLYKKYAGSTWIDPHDSEQVAFKDLPNRFPSVLSRDFRKEQGHYEDPDNLFAMYLLYNMGRYSVRVNEATRLLEIDRRKKPMAYSEAATLARQQASSDSEDFRRRLTFQAKGTPVGEPEDSERVYEFPGKSGKP